MNVLAGFERLTALLIMKTDGRGDRHGVDITLRQQVGVLDKWAIDVEFGGGRFGSPGHGIADGGEPHAVLEVVLAQVGKNAPNRDTAGADDADSNRTCHFRVLLSG